MKAGRPPHEGIEVGKGNQKRVLTTFQLVTLAERPNLIEALSDLHFTEWAKLYPSWTREICKAELIAQNDAERLPTTLVALDDLGGLVGSVSLLLDDLPGWECCSPWLASLFVMPHCRGSGIGGALVMAAVAEARRLGVERLYLFTPAHAHFYVRLGWAEFGQASANGQPVILMTRSTEIST